VRAGEHCLGQIGCLRNLPRSLERSYKLGGHQIDIVVTGRQECQRSLEQFYRDRRRGSGGLGRRLAKPADGLDVTRVGSAHEVISDL
jgi:hypothetical protein